MLLILSQWLMQAHPHLGFLRVFQYLTFRAVMAAMTALIIADCWKNFPLVALIALAALAADGFGVIVDQGIDIHRDILSLQGEDVLVVVQRLKVGGAGQHLDDAGAKQHAEGGRDDAQHDDAPQIAEQGFLFQGFQHFDNGLAVIVVTAEKG